MHALGLVHESSRHKAAANAQGNARNRRRLHENVEEDAGDRGEFEPHEAQQKHLREGEETSLGGVAGGIASVDGGRRADWPGRALSRGGRRPMGGRSCMCIFRHHARRFMHAVLEPAAHQPGGFRAAGSAQKHVSEDDASPAWRRIRVRVLVRP